MLISEATILIVDDEPQLTRIISAWMQRLGAMRILSAANGVAALEVLQGERVDVVISDVHMPLMDGITLLKRMNALGMSIPSIIFISGFSEVDKVQAYALGVEAMLSKPFTCAELQAAVTNSLADREALWGTATLPPPRLEAELESSIPAPETFGRGGFFAHSNECLEDGRIRFALSVVGFNSPIRGFGVVRWCKQPKWRVGVEFEYLEEPGRSEVLQAIAKSPPHSFIPYPRD